MKKMVIEYYANGKIRSVKNYLNGKLHGPYITYDDRGKKKYRDNFKNGSLFGEYEIWEGGKKYIYKYENDYLG